MKKALMKVAIVSSLILIPSFACYASGPGTTAAEFLKIGVGARATAMGEAFTALADDGTAFYWNPAGLAQIEKTELSAMYNRHFQAINQGYLSLASPLLGGTIGLGLNYVGMGQIEGRDEYGNPTGSFGASTFDLCAGYAREFGNKYIFGLSGGMIQDTIAGDTKTAFSANLGGLFELSESLTLGVVLQNLGTKLGSDPLPFIIKGGIAYRRESLTLAMDIAMPTDNKMYLCAGAEWWIRDLL